MTGVLVYADGAQGRDALRWAAAEARRGGHPLTALVSGEQAEDGGLSGARVLAPVGADDPGPPVTTRTTCGPVAAVVRGLSAEAAMLVVPAGLRGLPTVVAESYCPVVVVPAADRPAHRPAPGDGRVVLGAAPWTGEEVFGLAFRAAAQRGTTLVAVRTWWRPGIDVRRLVPWWVIGRDPAEEARRGLVMALSAWRVAYPDVTVQPLVVDDRPADFLAALSHRAGLLVLGRSARGALLAGIAGSPVADLARWARCPVMIVPGEGPPRRTWLPSRGGALARTTA